MLKLFSEELLLLKKTMGILYLIKAEEFSLPKD